MSFPRIMGVVNVTPDSFSDGGRFAGHEQAIEHGLRLRDEGADILDIGGESTRPGAVSVPADEEYNRVVPVIEGIRMQDKEVSISVDTSKSIVAREAIAAGADIINDVTAGMHDGLMFGVAAEHNVPLVLMHMQGEPRTMQKNPVYTDVVSDVKSFLAERKSAAVSEGVKEVYVDPGIGFGKSLEHNLLLLNNINQIADVAPVVLGISRKRFIGAITGVEDASQRDVPTAFIHALLLDSPIHTVRVHNVGMMMMLKTLAGRIIG